MAVAGTGALERAVAMADGYVRAVDGPACDAVWARPSRRSGRPGGIGDLEVIFGIVVVALQRWRRKKG